MKLTKNEVKFVRAMYKVIDEMPSAIHDVLDLDEEEIEHFDEFIEKLDAEGEDDVVEED